VFVSLDIHNYNFSLQTDRPGGKSCLQKLFQLISSGMKANILMAFMAVMIAAISVQAQSLFVVNEPTLKRKQLALSAAETRLMEQSVLPKVGKVLFRSLGDVCHADEYEFSNAAKGSFTRAGADQTLVFYQYCQTGNGLGAVGVAVLENGKVEASYVAEDGGWSVDARTLPDVNQNGLDEVALFFSGGMHQGEGGTGVEVIEFSKAGFKSFGWFQADRFYDDKPTDGYRVSVKKGATPVFYRQRFTSDDEKTWRRMGKQAPFRLGRPLTTFAAVK
jgi:hypothetical protein